MLLVSLTCCTPWSRTRPPFPAEYPTRRQVKVWTATQSVRLHSVRFRNDTLSGVPFTLPPDCDSCRVSLAMTAIDSIQTGGSDTGPILLAMTPIAIVVLLLLTIHPGDFEM